MDEIVTTISSKKVCTKSTRNSNLELYRIILMLGIIAHHYVVNSGLIDVLNFSTNPINTLYLQIFGWFGKTGINCFLLITGYFMCKQNFKWQKFLKLYLEIKFYKLIIFIILAVLGYQELSLSTIFFTVFNIAKGMNSGFTAAFFGLYIFIPFINILIKNMNRRQHFSAIAVLILIFTITSTFFFNSEFEYFGWYINIYLIGAYLRLYPNNLLNNKRFLIIATLIANIFVWASILASDFGFPINIYYFVADSNKIMALIVSILMFSLFKNVEIKQSKIINTVASSVFGVLLIHANSDAMRTFLWKDILRCTDYYNVSFGSLVLHSVFSVVAIFVICVIIDQIRINLFEKPLFKYIDKQSDRIEYFFKNKFDSFNKKIQKLVN